MKVPFTIDSPTTIAIIKTTVARMLQRPHQDF